MTKTLILAHVEHLRNMKTAGVLDFCGPCENGEAIMIYSANSQAEVEQYVADDPFSKQNYYRTRTISEVEEATLENNFHLEEVLHYLDNV